jgi:hypothetical protein
MQVGVVWRRLEPLRFPAKPRVGNVQKPRRPRPHPVQKRTEFFPPCYCVPTPLGVRDYIYIYIYIYACHPDMPLISRKQQTFSMHYIGKSAYGILHRPATIGGLAIFRPNIWVATRVWVATDP